MRVWTLEVADGIVPDASKFAQLLMSGATDVIWVGKVDCVDTENEDCLQDMEGVVFLDAEGNLTGVGDVDTEDDEE